MGLPLFPSLFTTKIPIVFESALMPELPPHLVLNKDIVLCFLLPSFFPFSLWCHRSLVLWPSRSMARLEPLLLCWGQQQWLPALSDTLHSGALWGSSSLWSSQLAAPSMELLTYKQTEARGARGSVILSSPAWGSASPYEWKTEATILSAALTSNLVCVIWGLRNAGGPPHLGIHCLLRLGPGGGGSPVFLATSTQSGASVKVSSKEGLGHCSSAMDSHLSYQGQFLESLNAQKYN